MDGKDTTADGRSDLLSKGNGTDEFCDGRKDTSLDQGQRSRADRRRVRVGHILATGVSTEALLKRDVSRKEAYVGTDTPDGDQEEDGTNGKEPVKVVIDSHFDRLCQRRWCHASKRCKVVDQKMAVVGRDSLYRL